MFILGGGLILIFHISYISSGDSTGSTPAQSEAAYDSTIRSHPSNILALNHETYGKFMVNALEISHLSYLLTETTA